MMDANNALLKSAASSNNKDKQLTLASLNDALGACGESDSDVSYRDQTFGEVRTTMATAPVDTTTLTTIINQCFSYATDARVSPLDQNSFLIEGEAS